MITLFMELLMVCNVSSGDLVTDEKNCTVDVYMDSQSDGSMISWASSMGSSSDITDSVCLVVVTRGLTLATALTFVFWVVCPGAAL